MVFDIAVEFVSPYHLVSSSWRIECNIFTGIISRLTPNSHQNNLDQKIVLHLVKGCVDSSVYLNIFFSFAPNLC